ncbi:hypothetical protein IMW75_24765 [Pseudomonas gregormendelii]|uniref:Uncharacterized protein n=1 Tax=Pseudomonas gregormendelii TaxID=1628277 RepID=A0ABS3ANU1_9PSED|nr:hypothetical protein [Pseudomonas gregormendelii]MBN3968471.1 hypothetical protein [Pseudomonas gregormendelii]
MALVILDGVIQEIGFGSYVDGQRVISFVKINGVRAKNVVCDDYMRSFLVVGRKVKLALVRRLLGANVLYSAQLEDGEIVCKDKALPVVQTMMIGLGFTLLLSPIFIAIVRATGSILVSLIILLGVGMSVAYFVMRDHFKARKVFSQK